MTNVLRSRFARPLVLAAAALIALGACGGDDDGGANGQEADGSTTLPSVFPTIPPVGGTTVAAGGVTVAPVTNADGTPTVPSTVTPGQVTTPIPPSTTIAGQTTVAGGGPTAEFSYTVVAGDCWSCIANKLGVDYNDLLEVNDATADTLLTPGEKIVVPGQGTGTTTAGSSSSTTAGGGTGAGDSGQTYTVVANDCWVCIADKLGVDLDDLYSVNGANADTVLIAGQKIKVPSGSGSTTVAGTTTTVR